MGAACAPPTLGDGLEPQGVVTALSVYDVRRGSVDLGASIRLTGLVATTAREAPEARLFVMDPRGGAESGLRLELAHPLPGVTVAPGDAIEVVGVVAVRGRERYLVVEQGGGLRVGAPAALEPTPVTAALDWEPYNAVLVRVIGAEVTGCGDAFGAVPLSAGVDLDPSGLPVPLGEGDRFDGVVGVVTGGPDRHALLLRGEADLEGQVDGGGCVRPAAAAGAQPGRARLRGAVIAAASGEAAFAQDPGGGPGVELLDLAGLGIAEGEVLDLEGVVVPEDGRSRLWVEHAGLVGRAGEAAPAAVRLRPGADLRAWDGGLVQIDGVQISGDAGDGRRATAAGLRLDPALMGGGDPLPRSGAWDITGVIRVFPDFVDLLPRRSTDLRPRPPGAPPGSP
jgi:hypothetical protein